jgi:hypothetical protein
MKYWAVTFTHTAYIEADTEAEAKQDCAEQVRENAEASECTAAEVSAEEFERHWGEQKERGEA